MKLDPRAQADLQKHLPRLLARARALLKLGGGPPDRLAPGELKRAAQFVSELHQGLVGERVLAQAATYDRAVNLGAYLLWWWPQSYARVRAALSMAPLPFASGGARTSSVRILDLGAGPGPAALAAADLLIGGGARVEALLLDESEAALAEAQALAAGEPRLWLQTQRSDLSRPAPAPGAAGFELITAAHLLSELPGGADERARFLRGIVEAQLAPDGALVVVEPALRETGRALLEVRDRLLGVAAQSLAHATSDAMAKPLRALAPCLTQAGCPALENPRDWCTAEIAWDAPPHILQLSRELGLHAETPLSFAPLLLSREVFAPPADVWRVVGVPPPEKGKKRLFVCAERGRLPVARLERDASAANESFDAAARGDLLRLRGLGEKGDGLRLPASGSSAAVAPAELLAGARGTSRDE